MMMLQPATETGSMRPPSLAASLRAYDPYASASDRLRYFQRFATLAPMWSVRWDGRPVALPRFAARPGGPGTPSAIDLLEGDRETGVRHASAVDAGAALHHIRLALDAFGEGYTIEEFPNGPSGEALARIALDRRVAPSGHALRMLAAAVRRHPAHAFANVIIPAASAKALANECRRERATFRVIVGDERDTLARTIVAAEREHGISTPEAPLVKSAPLACLVSTETDTRRDWLAAGQTLSALCLRGVDLGLSSVLVRSAIEVPKIRMQLADLTKSVLSPQLLLLMGPELSS